MRVDDYTWLGNGQKRNSVRVTSKESVKIGSIVVFDAAVMPFGAAVWPAFWSLVIFSLFLPFLPHFVMTRS